LARAAVFAFVPAPRLARLCSRREQRCQASHLWRSGAQGNAHIASVPASNGPAPAPPPHPCPPAGAVMADAKQQQAAKAQRVAEQMRKRVRHSASASDQNGFAALCMHVVNKPVLLCTWECGQCDLPAHGPSPGPGHPGLTAYVCDASFCCLSCPGGGDRRGPPGQHLRDVQSFPSDHAPQCSCFFARWWRWVWATRPRSTRCGRATRARRLRRRPCWPRARPSWPTWWV